MSRNSSLVFLVVLGLMAPATAFAQLTPPAGSAGAGNSAISGVPFGPANPVRSPIRAASATPRVFRPLTPNRPAPPVSYGSVDSPAPRARAVTSPYVGSSQRTISAYQTNPRHPPVRRRGRSQVSTFTGICRGC